MNLRQITIDAPKPRRGARSCLAQWMFAVVLIAGTATIARGEDSKMTGPEWVREGNRLLQEKDYAKALDAYDQAQIALPDSASINYNRGIALYELGRFDEAETALQNALRPDAIELEPDIKYNLGRSAQAAAMQTQGDMQAALDHTSRAIDYYKGALELRPEDADTKKNLGIAETQQKFLKKLIELAKEQQQQQPQQDQSKKDDSEEDEQQKDDQQQGQQQDSKDDKQDQQNQKSEGGAGKQDESAQNSDKSDKDAESKEQQGDQKQEDQSPESGDKQDEQKEQQGDSQDQRSDQQLGEDQLKEAEAIAAKQKKDEEDATNNPEDRDASEEKDEQEMQAARATSQSATSMPAESPLEMAKRISIDKANQRLQEARDNEARRRDALREARMRRLGRAKVEKDW